MAGDCHDRPPITDGDDGAMTVVASRPERARMVEAGGTDDDRSSLLSRRPEAATPCVVPPGPATRYPMAREDRCAWLALGQARVVPRERSRPGVPGRVSCWMER